MESPQLLTAAEAAAQLNVTRKTLLRWAREHKIERIKISAKVVLFSRDQIEKFIRFSTSKVPEPRATKRAKNEQPSKPKGGGKRISGELWCDLREEVTSWQ